MERLRLLPSKNEGDVLEGRDARGRFAPGWRGGPGNPFAARVQALRSALYDEVKPADLRKIIRQMIKSACNGDVAAAKVVLERTLGRVPLDVFAVIRELEQPEPNEAFL